MLIQVSESNLSPVYWTLVLWAMAVSFFLMQFLTIGTRINTRYKRSGGVLLTEQVQLTRCIPQMCAARTGSPHGRGVHR